MSDVENAALAAPVVVGSPDEILALLGRLERAVGDTTAGHGARLVELEGRLGAAGVTEVELADAKAARNRLYKSIEEVRVLQSVQAERIEADRAALGSVSAGVLDLGRELADLKSNQWTHDQSDRVELGEVKTAVAVVVAELAGVKASIDGLAGRFWWIVSGAFVATLAVIGWLVSWVINLSAGKVSSAAAHASWEWMI